MRKILLTILIITYSASVTLSQGFDTKVEITASYDKNEQAILLRWAPNDPTLWLKSLDQGYTLEKYVYQKDGKLLPIPLEKKIIYDSIIPEELNDWEDLVNQNDYAAIAAQCIYGDYIAFNGANSDIFSVVNKSKENESRFSMALFAADQSTEVADKSGLFYKDYDIKQDERYLYLVYSNYQDSLLQADTGAVYYGAADYFPNPSPRMSHAVQENGETQVVWYNSGYSDIYTSFIVERAFDNLEFKKINELPLINITEGPTKSGSFSTFVDTLQTTGNIYYRVKGKDIFGNISTPSDTLLVEAIPDYEKPIPSIDSIFIDNNNRVNAIVTVSGDKQYVNNVFFERSTKADGRYQLVESVEGLKKKFIDKNPIPNNYYRVGVSFFNSVQYSLPVLYNLIDSIPPSQPIIKSYMVKDSLLTLNWQKPKESDVANYRLYKAQFKEREPSLVAEIDAPDTSVVLEENLKFINNERYYYLTAVDQVGNTSELSVAFKVELPDRVPPAAPVISKIEQHKDTILINWKKSSSQDIKSYLIYKKTNNNYILIGVAPPHSIKFKETLSSSNTENFIYRVVALDSAKNESVSKPFNFKFRSTEEKKVQFHIELTQTGANIFWDTTLNGLTTCNIYLRNRVGELNLIKTVPYSHGEFSFDNETSINEQNIEIIFL